MAYEKKNRRTRAKRKLGRLASLSKARALVCEVRDGNALSIGGQDENRTKSALDCLLLRDLRPTSPIISFILSLLNASPKLHSGYRIFLQTFVF